MGSNYLCTTGKARHPFYIESIGIHIYTIEELCYYLKNYIYMIDETIINEKLCLWLGEELGLVKIQNMLLRSLERGESPVQFIMPIFKECSYYSNEELMKYQDQLADIQIEQEDIRRKMKADYLLGFGLYVNAITEYDKILSKRNPGRLGIQFYAQILNQMASAYAHLFRFEEAAECLWESYQSLRSKRIYENYLRLLPLFMTKEAYHERLIEIGAKKEEALRLKKEVEELLEESFLSEEAEKWEEIPQDEKLANLKEEYVRNTTGTR